MSTSEEFVPDAARAPRSKNDPFIVHAVMYRNGKMGTLCNSLAWGAPDRATAVTDQVSCPACREKLDGIAPTAVGRSEAVCDCAEATKARGNIRLHCPVHDPAPLPQAEDTRSEVEAVEEAEEQHEFDDRYAQWEHENRESRSGVEALAESERALIAKAGDHHPETCDCSVYAEDGGYPEHDICEGLSETFTAVEAILTSRTTSSGRPRNERDGECICNYGPDTDGPDECCPFHGRPYSYWVDAVGELTARHDADIAAAKATGAALHRDLVGRLGFGDNITEPMADNDTIVEWFEARGREANEWVESQRWRTDCHLAGHPEDQDCFEHDPMFAEEYGRAAGAAEVVARVEAVLARPDDRVEWEKQGRTGLHYVVSVSRVRAALTTGGEGR